ncbi:hypothetical protein P0W64_13175 [Tsukamurella sp. 8F]|uniref:hypothetical protein n=1 Tax=unclassified Tsukamurella TaxID=2633480 RepID=UPI0023B9DC70|nr:MULTISPECIES: hypothetical protein [unclassified Tsukamurella]MDF0530455.1 hypothetical protein [Tsukamurella sp. 8J]MDF0587724.1 hypothetical protein [Tsukamurella sp. 8F]
MPGFRPDLSDGAALLIAAGRLPQQTREVVLRRFESDATFPDLGGYARLRRLTRTAERASSERRREPLAPLAGAIDAAESLRAAEARRKLGSYRHGFTVNRRSFGAGVRAVRRARRDAVHLDLDERDLLFDALCRTPAPIVPGSAALAARRFVRAAAPVVRLATLHAPDAIADWVEGHRPPDTESSVFDDRYEVLLYVAGAVYDRVVDSRSAHSGELDEQLLQLDLATDLVQISADATALGDVWGNLRGAPGLADGARSGELDRVWNELVDRVVALSAVGDLVDAEDKRIGADKRSRSEVAASVDEQIDELVRRSGERELSIAGARRVAAQLEQRVVARLPGRSAQALPAGSDPEDDGDGPQPLDQAVR